VGNQPEVAYNYAEHGHGNSGSRYKDSTRLSYIFNRLNPLRTGGFGNFAPFFFAPCLPGAITFLFFGAHSHMRAFFLRDKLYFTTLPCNVVHNVVGSGKKIPNGVKLQKKSDYATVFRVFYLRRSIFDKTDQLLLFYSS
jgi:hypothetical protein